MATNPISGEPTTLITQPRRPVSSRPEEALRQLASDLAQVSSVVVQTEALGHKMVELGQSFAQVKPAFEGVVRDLAVSNERLQKATDRLYSSADGLEQNYFTMMQELDKRLSTLTGLVIWALLLGGCVVAGGLIGMFLLLRPH